MKLRSIQERKVKRCQQHFYTQFFQLLEKLIAIYFSGYIIFNISISFTIFQELKILANFHKKVRVKP